MRDLLERPLWRAEDLGRPLPDSEFGVSVCLPLWRHVIGYEERDPEVLRHFQSGYPRFCCPPAVGALFEAAEQDLARVGERCLVFPRERHAQRCLDFISRRTGLGAGRVVRWRAAGLGVAVFPGEGYEEGRRFWRICGEVVSTRQACEVLGRWPGEVTAEEGGEASRVIRERLAALSGQAADDVFLFPSGMAANFAVHRMLTHRRAGRKTVQLDFPYVDVLKLQEVFGAGAHFLPLLGVEEYDGALRPLLAGETVAGIFAEAPSNPLLRCVDLARVRRLMAELQPEVPLVVDDTVASVVNVDAFRFADVVTTSLTKTFSGVGDVLAGSVILNRRSMHYREFAAFLMREADHELWQADAAALEVNSRDVVERARRTSANARRLAEHLRGHPAVGRVWYPDVDGGVGFEAIRREGAGYGCLLSFVLRDVATSARVFDALEVSKGPSLGTNFTLACPYTLLAHYDELDWAEACGVPRDLIRVSVGLEEEAELRARFDRALAEG